MSNEGVYDFYRDRLMSAPNYGLKGGHQIIATVCRCAFHDSLLTNEEFSNIIKLCEDAHIKVLEANYNEGWNE